MESLPRVKILEFHHDTLQAVRKEFNLDDKKRLDEAIDILEDWVKKQSHFVKKDFSRDFFERIIISAKGSVERAKVRFDRYCTFKTLLPEYFNNRDIESMKKRCDEFIVHAHIPRLTPEHHRVYFFKLNSQDSFPSTRNMRTFYNYGIMLSEYVKRYDYFSGFMIVLDYTEAAIMNFVTKVNLVDLRQFLTILVEGYGMRLKGMHIITPSKMVDALASIFKSMLSEKLSKRIYVHKTVDTLYEHIPKEILPVEYGGQEKSLKMLQEEMFQVISSPEYHEYLEEINEAKTNESYRQTDKFNDEYIGMPGSFRSLSVD